MSDPQVRRSKIATGIGEDPFQYILELYTKYLQGLFNWLPEGEFHWEPDHEVTEILILAQAPLDTETVGKNPLLTVVLGPSQFAGLGIDNLLTFDPMTGERVRTDLINGHIVVYCLAESDIIATRLGHIVSHFTRVHQRILESPGGFHQIARPSPSINSPSPPGALVQGDAQGLVMVQVNIPYHFQWTWKTSINRQAPQFRSIDMIMEKRRARDYEYTSLQKLERVELAMSIEPVIVKRITGSRVSVVEATDGIEGFFRTTIVPSDEE